jgi:hypothetical protein
MSTITSTEVHSTFSTFKPRDRKYDLRTAEGKYFKRLDSFSDEYTVTTGVVTVPEERGYAETATVIDVTYDAIHLVRTVAVDNDLVETYLKGRLQYDWQARDKKKASFVVVNEALYQERWGSGFWVHVDYSVWSLEEGGELVVTTSTLNATSDHLDISRIIAKALGNRVAELNSEVQVHETRKAKADEHARKVADVVSAFVPSYAYERALAEATKVIERGVTPSEGDDSQWHNHVHVAIDIEVQKLCKRFVAILGQTTDHVRIALNSYNEDIRIVDENIAYATVIAERTGHGWSSNDFSGALLGQVLHRFTKIVCGNI